MPSPPSTGPSDTRGRRSFALVREDCRGAIPPGYRNYVPSTENFVRRCEQWLRRRSRQVTPRATSVDLCYPEGVDRIEVTPKPNHVVHRRIAFQQPEQEIPDVQVLPTPDRARR